MGSIRVLLCNRHPIVRSGLRLLLERESELRVVGEAADGREAIALAEYKHPDIVLLDVKLPLKNGIVAAAEICSKNSNAKIIFVTFDVDEEYVAEAFKAGAHGYVLAGSAQSDLIRAVRVVRRGDKFLSPGITLQLLDEYARKHQHNLISDHEKQLFCLLAAGYDDREIARQFDTTVDSARSDCESVRNILPHLGILSAYLPAPPN